MNPTLQVIVAFSLVMVLLWYAGRWWNWQQRLKLRRERAYNYMNRARLEGDRDAEVVFQCYYVGDYDWWAKLLPTPQLRAEFLALLDSEDAMLDLSSFPRT